MFYDREGKQIELMDWAKKIRSPIYFVEEKYERNTTGNTGGFSL